MLMRITEDSESCFRAIFRTGFHWSLAVGALVASAFVIVGGLGAELTMIRLAGGQIDVRVTRTLFGMATSEVVRNNVVDAHVEIKATETNDIGRLVLVSPSESSPVFEEYDSRIKFWNEMAVEVRDFIGKAGGLAESNIHVGLFWLPLIAGLFFLGLLSAHCLTFGSFVVDKSSKELRFFRWNCCFPTIRVFEFSQVSAVDIVNRRVCVRMRSGDWIPYGPVYDGDVIQRMLDRANQMLLESCFSARTDSTADVKRCVICGEDCTNEPRAADQYGNYYHQRCYTGA